MTVSPLDQISKNVLMDIASDAVLLQLEALFGPMLTSALQLVDKRDGQLVDSSQEKSS